MTTQTVDELLTAGDAAKIAEVSPDTIRNWSDNGRLPSVRTAGGVRLFERSAVDRVVSERQARQKED